MRNKKLRLLLLTMWITAWPCLAEDAAVVLARMLAGKGVLTRPEMLAIESGSEDARVGMLGALLVNRGILAPQEVAALGSPERSETAVRFVPAVYEPAAPVQASAQGATTAPKPPASAPPPVTAASKFPVSI